MPRFGEFIDSHRSARERTAFGCRLYSRTWTGAIVVVVRATRRSSYARDRRSLARSLSVFVASNRRRAR